MGAHLIDGEFQSDKYPTTPRGKVPLSVKDPTAQDLLWDYADRRQAIDAEFSTDLRVALLTAGYHPAQETEVEQLRRELKQLSELKLFAESDDGHAFMVLRAKDLAHALREAAAIIADHKEPARGACPRCVQAARFRDLAGTET